MLPIITGISGALTFPAVPTPVTVSVTASATAPASGIVVPAANRLHVASGSTLTVYEYITIESPLTITLPSLPALTLTFPASTSLAGLGVFYGISDLHNRGGIVSFDTHGPATLQGQTASFPAIPPPITFVAKHAYTFVVYASPVASNDAVKIFVTSNFEDIVAYDGSGNVTTPTITDGLSNPFGLEFASGKLYAANSGNNTVTTYEPDGTRTTPTITAGLNVPLEVTVDGKGKIYVANMGNSNGGSVTTYLPNGVQTKPTIAFGFLGPQGVAVGPSGSIYVINPSDQEVDIYAANGTPTGKIVAGIDGANAVAASAAGKIYVANFSADTITTYEANGSQTTPTITAGLTGPQGLALDDAGKIYVLNANGEITTYNSDGTQSTPTISGPTEATGIAVQTIH